ncbi:MAG: extracellular solute-binding protein [Gemmatimonadales bacterium]
MRGIRSDLIGRALLMGAWAAAPGAAQQAAPAMADTLVVYHAGSLTDPMRELADTFECRHPGVRVRRESGGSVDLATRALDPGRVPDVLALADYAIIPRLLMPAHTGWYAIYAGNAMVIASSAHETAAAELTGENWMDVLLRPGVHAGHSDPALDPGGYRAVLIFQLAEEFYHRPGLADSLARAVPTVAPPAGRTLYDLLDSGELDYVITYRSSAHSRGFRVAELPPAVNLSDAGLASTYARAVIRLPARPGATDSISLHGEPIQYGVTTLTGARHADLAAQFVSLLLSETGRGALQRGGFVLPAAPTVVGNPPATVWPR